MEEDPEKTTIFPRKDKSERRQELEELLAAPSGLELLAHLYQAYFPLAPGAIAPRGPIMIARILSKEFPDG